MSEFVQLFLRLMISKMAVDRKRSKRYLRFSQYYIVLLYPEYL
jgi:hypothetical protein